MEDYDDVFTETGGMEPPEGLLNSICSRIEEEKNRRKKIRFFGGITSLFVSLAGFIPALLYLKAEIVQTGFYEYASLAISDWEIVLRHWQDFGLSLLESLPIFGMVFVLAASLGCLWSLHLILSKTKPSFKLA